MSNNITSGAGPRALSPSNLHQRHQIPVGLTQILREASGIIEAISIKAPAVPVRWPIVDELIGYAGMLEDAQSVENLAQKSMRPQYHTSDMIAQEVRSLLSTMPQEQILATLRQAYPELLQAPRVVIVTSECGRVDQILSTAPIDVANFSYDVEDYEQDDIFSIPQNEDATVVAEAVGSLGPTPQIQPERTQLLYGLIEEHNQRLPQEPDTHYTTRPKG